MGDHSAIEWTEATWNPTTGCDKTSPGCDNCLDPSTPVLMADMSWRPIGEISVGDRVIAFTESPPLGENRVYEVATVEGAWRTVQPAVELLVGERSIIASEDHRFLAPSRPYWRQAGALDLRSRIVDIGMPALTPQLEDDSYLAGYAAGVIAGDGTFRWESGWRSDKLEFPQMYCRVAVLLDDIAILERLELAYAAHGIGHPSIRRFDSGSGQVRPMVALETRARASLEAIANVLLPERNDLSWKAGWLAGMFDTDGMYGGKNLRWSQRKDPTVLDRVAAYGHDLGIEIKVENHPGEGCPTAIVLGRVEDKIRALGTLRPALERKCRDFVGRRVVGRTATTVDSVHRVQERELVDIQTSSGTFIAAGLATHNCYALTLSKRLKAMGQAKYQRDGDPRTSGPGFGLTLHPDTLEIPRSWTSPRVIFVNSMSDLFHQDVPEAYIRQVFEVIAGTPQHQYQVLTKRSKRLASLGPKLEWPPNLWMGVSVENSKYRFRIDHLRRVDAAIRFVSAEPLLGPLENLDLDGIHWLIAGGESGPRSRPMDESWVIDLRDQCRDARVPFFFKQWGGHTPKAGGRELEGQTHDEMPHLDLV